MVIIGMKVQKNKIKIMKVEINKIEMLKVEIIKIKILKNLKIYLFFKIKV